LTSSDQTASPGHVRVYSKRHAECPLPKRSGHSAGRVLIRAQSSRIPCYP
jgi:hypothetical protein